MCKQCMDYLDCIVKHWVTVDVHWAQCQNILQAVSQAAASRKASNCRSRNRSRHRQMGKSQGEHFPICTAETSVTPGRTRDVLTHKSNVGSKHKFAVWLVWPLGKLRMFWHWTWTCCTVRFAFLTSLQYYVFASLVCRDQWDPWEKPGRRLCVSVWSFQSVSMNSGGSLDMLWHWACLPAKENVCYTAAFLQSKQYYRQSCLEACNLAFSSLLHCESCTFSLKVMLRSFFN